jgi:hypothetical protein
MHLTISPIYIIKNIERSLFLSQQRNRFPTMEN